MTKKELVSAIAEQTNITKKDTEIMINALVDAISEGLANGEEITISGFGKFLVRERGERTGRNPRTGETITIAPTKIPAFKPAKALKDSIKAE